MTRKYLSGIHLKSCLNSRKPIECFLYFPSFSIAHWNILYYNKGNKTPFDFSRNNRLSCPTNAVHVSYGAN